VLDALAAAVRRVVRSIVTLAQRHPDWILAGIAAALVVAW
jgi:hypothetical protein